jgi:hypothetical protein
MSTLLVPWVAFPLLFVALSWGCGLLLERVAGLKLPGALVVPCGFGVVALVAQFAVLTDVTAELATPAVIVTAVAGFVIVRPWRDLHVDSWAIASGVGAFAAYAAPIVLSGAATFAGYIKLDDDSTLTALVDRAMEHGRSVDGLEFSTYYRVVDLLLDEGYPLASLLPMGIGHDVVRSDALWLYQPAMAVMAAMLALGLYALAGQVVQTRWMRAVAAVVGAQSALLYGYALWGGIKEIGTAWALPVLAALVPLAARSERLRHLLPLAALSALLLGVLNAGALVWLAPALGTCLVLVVRRRGLRGAVRPTAAFIGFLAAFALPTIVAAPAFLTSNIVSYDPIANLGAPLNPIQMAGIWPAGDFRVDPELGAATKVLILVAVIAAAALVVWMLRRQSWALPIYVVGAVASAAALWIWSTPWIEGKAFATAAPAIPFAAVVAGGLLLASGRVVEGAVLGAVVTGAVLWSNVLQYHDVWLGPREQLAELSVIGQRFAGEGPALQTEYQPYGVRHFLRKLDAEGASELRVRPVSLRDGRQLDKGSYANLDEFADADIRVYRTLVLRRSPTESRPASDYRLAWSGDWYDVWQRSESVASPVVEHLPLGEGLQPGAVPDCAEVERLAAVAGDGGQLAAVVRPPVVSATVARTTGRAETVEASVDVPRPGHHGIWLGGSFRDGLEARVDGRVVGRHRHRLDNQGGYTLLGEAELAAGTHTVTLRFSGPDLHPGSSGATFGIGPLVLSTTTAADAPVTVVPAARARELCGKRLDWVEALRG